MTATVLLVDDQVMIAETLRRMLADAHDIRFFHCEDPAEALRMADEVKPTVILQDLVMPGVDGITLVRYFRAHPPTRDIPMIVLSAKEEPTIKAQAFAVGANDYMVKLPDRLEVLARIRYHSRAYTALVERNEAQRQLELRNRFIREAFGRYLSDEIVESLLETPEGLRLGGEKRKVTILMADLRGFTPLAEGLRPEQVVSLLNRYLGAMTDVIVDYGGTIDEFIGDAILVIFGAPILRPDDAPRAVACALAMQRAMRMVNAGNASEGLPEIAMGIGVHTGEVVVGNIGSQKRAKYGVVGAPVNIASRIESYTGRGQILISEETRAEVGPILRIDHELQVEPKGSSAPITIHEVGAIAGSYRIELPRRVEPVVRLAIPLEVACTVIEQRDQSGPIVLGRVVALSEASLVIASAEALPPLVTLKLSLLGVSGGQADNFYGRTRDPVDGGMLVRLTSVPAAVGAYLRASRDLPPPDLVPSRPGNRMTPERLGQMRAIMIEECGELLEQFRADLQALGRNPDEAEVRERLARPPHTVASGAGMIGELELSEFAERVESAARLAREAGFALGPERLEALAGAEVVLGAYLRHIQGDAGGAPDLAPADLALRRAFEGVL